MPNEVYGPDGKLVSSTPSTGPEIPSMTTIQNARTALKTLQAKPNLNADIKAIIDFLLLLSYEYEGANTNV